VDCTTGTQEIRLGPDPKKKGRIGDDATFSRES
jgi:hypothetical protein